MELIIDRYSRNALYQVILAELSSIGDIAIEISSMRPGAARSLRVRFEREMRLLDDLGWDQDASADTVLITMPTCTLRPTLERLYWSAAGTLALMHELEPDVVEFARHAQLTCSELLARLVEQPSGEE